MKQQFTKSDLKPMMRVKLRNGQLLVICDDNTMIGESLVNSGKLSRYSLEAYDDDLKREYTNSNNEYDIVKVFSKPVNYFDYFDMGRSGAVLWERVEEVKKLEYDSVSIFWHSGKLIAQEKTPRADTIEIDAEMVTKLSMFCNSFAEVIKTDDWRNHAVVLKVGCFEITHEIAKEIIALYKEGASK